MCTHGVSTPLQGIIKDIVGAVQRNCDGVCKVSVLMGRRVWKSGTENVRNGAEEVQREYEGLLEGDRNIWGRENLREGSYGVYG